MNAHFANASSLGLIKSLEVVLIGSKATIIS